MRKFVVGLVLLVSFSTHAYSQDTLRMMQYNLLYFGKNLFGCNQSTNNITAKLGHLRTISEHVQPDILAVNEIGPFPSIHQKILDSVLNVNGAIHFRKSGYTNTSNSSVINMLYYNGQKLTLYSENYVATSIRDINIYKLYYNSTALALGDTAFLTCIVTHLKAGNGSYEAGLRDDMATALMNKLDSIGIADNYILSGDFNTYTSNEACYQKFINHSNPLIRFYDPINKPGNWNNSSSYSNYHTQSTHTYTNGCPSGGGMDDRFDFILASYRVMNGTHHYRYMPGSYKALGQDGNHFNSSITSGTNNSVPANVLYALYNMSDHLPIVMDIDVDLTLDPSTSGDHIKLQNGIHAVYNYSDHSIRIRFPETSAIDFSMELYSMDGRLVFQEQDKHSRQHISHLPDLSEGVYMIRIRSGLYQYTKRYFIPR